MSWNYNTIKYFFRSEAFFGANFLNWFSQICLRFCNTFMENIIPKDASVWRNLTLGNSLNPPPSIKYDWNDVVVLKREYALLIYACKAFHYLYTSKHVFWKRVQKTNKLSDLQIFKFLTCWYAHVRFRFMLLSVLRKDCRGRLFSIASMNFIFSRVSWFKWMSWRRTDWFLFLRNFLLWIDLFLLQNLSPRFELLFSEFSPIFICLLN